MTAASGPSRNADHRFGLKTSRTRDRLFIHVHGELAGESAHHLEEVLAALAGPNDHIVIDLSEVTRLDDEGLEVLRRSRGHALALRAHITLDGLSTRLRRLLSPQDRPTTNRQAEIWDMSFRGGSMR